MHETINRLRNKKGDEGFTLIELLVVVVIIGVLVAIAVPVYLNYRKGAADKSAQSDVRGAVSAVEQFYTDNNNTYPISVDGVNGTTTLSGVPTATSLGLMLATGGTATQTITLSDKTQLGYVNNGSSYVLCGNNTGGSGKWYFYDSSVGGSVKASTKTVTTLSSCS
ncbi:prepilin-type N-terminal cleavage/methylation domain-containing protein [Actinoplanes subtropicus]|uniref:prepilin-type N-terminal cleavage/methylation domain-containing protein n=1 Tax=Actinoplanes subtropicus TaxID=543632 RepID=UPI0004C390C9|nr:prepilin-type N-terminal cleavage/methylation domain-containing protein [Actinoplanes subtropicus]